ncbi:PEP-CTERM sorting domain-containing protein [Okeania sp. KiyG1]|uniref:PEP-CTERM sorting domain-containing protein n=1 Tax=Okeania sp. KiyG1 TaxID=2720165 RepID=UPI00192414C5|nr:PEP-CTERM sorting domain-containing protein [Okeania sp. KiyG1]GGA36228.1 hypothetical protein CYANOKiyG1_54020 [Okeania sp. KiyG1]
MKWSTLSVTVLVALAAVDMERALAVDITAKVNGMDMVIGTLDAKIDTEDSGRIIGEFLFAPEKAFLDDWYDFRWVNVETKYTVDDVMEMTDPVLGKLPAIDPAPFPFDMNEDNEPYYFNDTEWANGVFNGVKIHEEGKASRFVDRPRDGNKNSMIDFTTYLVVDNLTDPTFPKTTFDVLGWFDWTYDNKGNFVNGMSTIGTISSVVTDGNSINPINTAIGNAEANGFPGWKAAKDINLTACVPEPSTTLGIVLLGLGVLSTKKKKTKHLANQNVSKVA